MAGRQAETVFRVMVTALAAASFADIGRVFYGWLTGVPGANRALSGRWFLMVFEGYPVTSNIAAEPAQPFEYAVGYGAYYVVSFFFAAAYLMFVRTALKRPPGLLNGLAFGLATIVFPLLVQMPAMGSGFFALNTPMPLALIGRTLVHHVCFGLGLGAGALMAGLLLRNSQNA